MFLTCTYYGNILRDLFVSKIVQIFIYFVFISCFTVYPKVMRPCAHMYTPIKYCLLHEHCKKKNLHAFHSFFNVRWRVPTMERALLYRESAPVPILNIYCACDFHLWHNLVTILLWSKALSAAAFWWYTQLFITYFSASLL